MSRASDKELAAAVRAAATSAGMDPRDWLRMRTVDRARPSGVSPAIAVNPAPAVSYRVEVWSGGPLESSPVKLLDEWNGLFHTPPEAGDVIYRHASRRNYVVMGRTHIDGRLVLRVAESA